MPVKQQRSRSMKKSIVSMLEIVQKNTLTRDDLRKLETYRNSKWKRKKEVTLDQVANSEIVTVYLLLIETSRKRTLSVAYQRSKMATM